MCGLEREGSVGTCHESTAVSEGRSSRKGIKPLSALTASGMCLGMGFDTSTGTLSNSESAKAVCSEKN